MAVPKRSAAGIKGRETSHDGGYSWVVLAASFMMSVHYSFSLSHFGIFLVEYIEYFNVKKSTLIWIGALLLFVGFALGMYNICLPLRNQYMYMCQATVKLSFTKWL